MLKTKPIIHSRHLRNYTARCTTYKAQTRKIRIPQLKLGGRPPVCCSVVRLTASTPAKGWAKVAIVYVIAHPGTVLESTRAPSFANKDSYYYGYHTSHYVHRFTVLSITVSIFFCISRGGMLFTRIQRTVTDTPRRAAPNKRRKPLTQIQDVHASVVHTHRITKRTEATLQARQTRFMQGHIQPPTPHRTADKTASFVDTTCSFALLVPPQESDVAARHYMV